MTPERALWCKIVLIAWVALLIGVSQQAEALNPNHGCASCHSLHGAPGGNLLKDATSELVCLTCHGPAGVSTLKADVHNNQTCVVCHASHSDLPNILGPHTHADASPGGTNIKLIGRNVDGTGLAKIATPNSGTRPVVFESRGPAHGQSNEHAYAPGIAGYEGVCETCHTSTNFHRNNASGDHAHNSAATCTGCHEHSNRFKGNCTSAGCHEPGGTYDPLTTGGSGSAGKHIVHVTNRGQECTTCHTGYFGTATHDNGTLNGKIDEIGPVAFNALSPSGTYTDQSQTLGSGTCNGTSCHQADTLDWYDTNPAPTWPTVCTDCHTPGSVIDPLTLAGSGTDGKHTRHVTDMGFACASCHDQYVASPQTTALHMNGELDTATSASLVGFNAGENPSAVWQDDRGLQMGSCASTYCHGATDGVTSVANEPAWYTLPVLTWSADTSYTLDDIVFPATPNGYYYKALAGGVSGIVEPSWQTGFAAQVSDGAVAWRRQGATSGLPCEDCHSAGSFIDPLTINGTDLDGQHVKHVSGKGYDCAMCHNGYDQDAAHVDFAFGTGSDPAIVDFDSDNTYANDGGGWNVASASCGRTYCHGATRDGTMVAPNVPVWYTTVPPAGLPCTGCHNISEGDQNNNSQSFINPIWLDERVSSNSGLHKKHADPSKENIPCLICHSTYIDDPDHANLSHVSPSSPTEADAQLLDDLIEFDPQVSANPAAPDSFWSGAIGGWLGGCGGSLCHNPVNEIHNPGRHDYTDPTLGPLSGWFNR